LALQNFQLQIAYVVFDFVFGGTIFIMIWLIEPNPLMIIECQSRLALKMGSQRSASSF
jgi:hypothetical protein